MKFDYTKGISENMLNALKEIALPIVTPELNVDMFTSGSFTGLDKYSIRLNEEASKGVIYLEENQSARFYLKGDGIHVDNFMLRNNKVPQMWALGEVKDYVNFTGTWQNLPTEKLVQLVRKILNYDKIEAENINIDSGDTDNFFIISIKAELNVFNFCRIIINVFKENPPNASELKSGLDIKKNINYAISQETIKKYWTKDTYNSKGIGQEDGEWNSFLYSLPIYFIARVLLSSGLEEVSPLVMAGNCTYSDRDKSISGYEPIVNKETKKEIFGLSFSISAADLKIDPVPIDEFRKLFGNDEKTIKVKKMSDLIEPDFATSRSISEQLGEILGIYISHSDIKEKTIDEDKKTFTFTIPSGLLITTGTVTLDVALL